MLQQIGWVSQCYKLSFSVCVIIWVYDLFCVSVNEFCWWIITLLLEREGTASISYTTKYYWFVVVWELPMNKMPNKSLESLLTHTEKMAALTWVITLAVAVILLIVEASEEANWDAQTMMMMMMQDQKSLLRWSKWEGQWRERADAKQLMREAAIEEALP